MQEYIYNTLRIENSDWRENTETVRLFISLHNTIALNEFAEKQLLDISNGTKKIIEWRSSYTPTKFSSLTTEHMSLGTIALADVKINGISNIRPVVILRQHNHGILVAPISSHRAHDRRTEQFRIIISRGITPMIKNDSTILLDWITTIGRSDLKRIFGRLSNVYSEIIRSSFRSLL